MTSNRDSSTEADLIAAARTGSTEALGELYQCSCISSWTSQHCTALITDRADHVHNGFTAVDFSQLA